MRRYRSVAGVGPVAAAVRTGWSNRRGEVAAAGGGRAEPSTFAFTNATVPSFKVKGQVVSEADFWQCFFGVCVFGQQEDLDLSKGQAVAALEYEKPHSAKTSVKAVRIRAAWIRYFTKLGILSYSA